MKKFNLPLTAAISAAILACAGCKSDRDWQASTNTRVCVDNSGKRVDDSNCNNQHFGGGYNPFLWYYIARGGYVPWFNHSVSGGGYYPSGPATTYSSAPATAPAGAITRGGFGGIGAGHAGGGEGAGE